MTLLKLPQLSLHWCPRNLMIPRFILDCVFVIPKNIVAVSSRHRQFKATSVDSFAWSRKKTGRFMECAKMCQLWWGGKFQLASTLYGKVRFLLKSVGWRWCICICWITTSHHFAKFGTQSWLKEVDNGHLGFIKLSWVLSPVLHCWKIDDLQQTWATVCSWTSTNTQKSHPLTCFSIEMRIMLRLDALQRTVESVGMAVQRCGARDGCDSFAFWICHLNLWDLPFESVKDSENLIKWEEVG